jgi:transcriptional regulator with XRE-family HTH domain
LLDSQKFAILTEYLGEGMTINKRIVELRHALKLSQPVFAEKICISKSYIAHIELGKPINERIIRLICTTFSVNPVWLKTGEGHMFYDTPGEKIEEIVSIFRRLNPFFQDYFLNQLRQIYEYETRTKNVENESTS